MRVIIICSTGNNTSIVSSIKETWESFIHAGGRRENFHNKTKQNKNILVVKSKNDFEKCNFEKENPDFVFIQTDLDWLKIPKSFSGYEIALDLFLHKLKNHFFNVQFISIEERLRLSSRVDIKYRKIVQCFHHIEFPIQDNVSFVKFNYSPLHFELIKALVINDKNRINVIEHDLDKIKGDLNQVNKNSDITSFKVKIQTQIEELSILKFIIAEKLEQLKKAIDKSIDKTILNKNILEFENILDDIKKDISDSGQEEFGRKNKSNYKVLIIDDDKEDREFFSTTFSEIYQTVFPGNREEIQNFNIVDAKEIIKTKRDYNIFVLDLLYKDSYGFWLPFNGLDLYQYIKELNPYSCIRIITSLPRDIVSKISGLLLKTDIKVSHVFTKKVGYKRLKFGIYDRVLEMNIECQENEKTKTVYKPIPKLGIFGWDGVNDLLFNLMTMENEQYEKCWDKAFTFFEQFELRKLNQSTTDWESGKLPSPQKQESVTSSYILKRLPVIFAHRLLVISKALESSNSTIDAENYENTVLKSISKISTFDRGYIQTKLGFNATAYENAIDRISGFKIIFQNLFPEEVLFISDILKKRHKNFDDEIKSYTELSNWFNAVLCDLEIYESWEELKLDFYPYIAVDEINNKGVIELKNIDSALTLSQLEKYLRALIKKSYDEFVQKIIDKTTEHYMSMISAKHEKKIPQYILAMIDDLFKIE